MLVLAERLVFRDAIAARSAGDIKIVHDHADRFCHANGGDHEIRAAQAERRQPNQERGKNRDGCSTDETEIWTMSGMHEQRRGVRA